MNSREKRSRRYDPENPVFETSAPPTIKPILGINDHPKSVWETLFYAWQITLVDFTPFIWTGVFVSLAGLPDSVLPGMISACFLTMGVATFIQTTFGNRLPIVQGPSTSVLTAMGGVAGAYGLAAMWGGALVGAVLEMLFGLSRLFSLVRRFISPVITGAVITAIGFVACRIALTWMFSYPTPLHLSLAFAALVLALTLKFCFKGIISTGFVVLSTLLIGVGAATPLGLMDWAKVAEAPWFALPSFLPQRELISTGGPFAFTVAAILGCFTGYVGSMFESLGDYAATCAVSGETYRVKHINRGIAAEGAGCVVACALGALPVTSYTQNIGIIASTGIASRRVTQVAAGFFLLYGLSPKLAVLFSVIPRSVLGGIFLICAAMIVASGLDVIASEKRSFANSLVAGITLGTSVMLPVYSATIGKAWVTALPAFLQMGMGNSILIAMAIGISLHLMVHHILRVDARI